MANTSVRTVIGQLPSDGSTVDLTVSGETRTPNGCVVITTSATALDIATDDLSVSFGVTDFTDVACISCTDEHGQSTTDTQKVHQETNIIEMHTPGTSTVIRSATVTAITGGIRLDAVEASGAQFRVQAIIVFGSACKAFSVAGPGVVGNTVNVAHGMTTEPGAGIYGFNQESSSGSTNGRIGLGFHAYDGTIEQACCSWFFNNGQSVTTSNGTRVLSNRVASSTNNSGAENEGFELTAIDTTNCTYTNRDTATTADLIGLLIECDDVSSAVDVIDSPTSAASDWNANHLAFQSQFVAMLGNRCAAVDVAETDLDAGAGSFMAMDEDGSEHSCAWSSEDNITLGTSNTSSELAQAIFLPTDAGGDTHLMSNPTFTADGWDFLAAVITAANGTARKWPSLAIEQTTTGINKGVLRRRRP